MMNRNTRGALFIVSYSSKINIFEKVTGADPSWELCTYPNGEIESHIMLGLGYQCVSFRCLRCMVSLHLCHRPHLSLLIHNIVLLPWSVLLCIMWYSFCWYKL
jgi:hypothetical protein